MAALFWINMSQLKDYLFYQDDWATIYCGDCLEIMPLMEPESVDLVVTDPPFGTNLNDHDVNPDKKVWQEIKRISDHNPIAIIAYPSKLFEWFMSFPNKKIIGYIIWFKYNQPMVSQGLTRIHQDILILGQSIRQFKMDNFREPYQYKESDYGKIQKLGRANPLAKRLNKGTWEPNPNGRRCTDLWKIAVPQNGANSFLKFHPNQKPIELIQRLILLLSTEMQLIFDPFLGSGTTCVAAKNLNRKSIGIEINPKYCEISVKRLRQEVFDFRRKE